MAKRGTIFGKATAIICAVVLVMAALWVPVAFSAFADSNIAFFGFEDAIADANKNKQDAIDKGVGYYGWGFSPTANPDGGSYLNYTYDSTTNYWGRGGGLRVNNANGVYNLEPSTSYVVAMKLRVVSGPVTIEGSNSASIATVTLGYNASFNPNLSGDSTNYVNTMSKTITNVLTCRFDSAEYSLTTGEGAVNVPYSKEWKTVIYTFTTPADMGDGDKALTIWARAFAGFSCQIDDLTVVKLGDNEGAVVAVDDYSEKYDVFVGEIGSAIALPEISDRARQNNHSFVGWGDGNELAFSKNAQTVNSKWDAPVTYTFKDLLNGKDYVLNGQAKTEYTIPADPVDASKKTWFMGWYTDQSYTELFENNFFGYEDRTLYSRWESEIPTLKQDFENYTKDQYKVVDDKGYKVKDNRLYFSMMMEKQSKVTYGGSNYAVKFTWDKNMNKTPDNPSSYVAAERYDDMDMYFWLGSGIDNQQKYIVTFKYNVEVADTDMIFYITSAKDHNIWDTNQTYSSFTAPKSDAGAGWKEGKIEFTTNFKSEVSKTMFLGIKFKENQNVTLYVDDVEINPEAQPYEALVNVVPNNGEGKIVIKGIRGEKIELPTLTNANGTKFLGWYADEALTVPFEETVYQRKPVTVYAKWSVAPLTFKDYPYYKTPDNQGFGKELSLDGSGVGIDDDWALRVNFAGNHVYKVDENGNTLYMNSRYSQLDHLAAVAKNITNGAVYKLTYSYKVVDANTVIKVTPLTGHTSNIWVAEQRNAYPGASYVISDTKSDWKEQTVYFSADIKNGGSTLYLSFTFGSGDLSAKANLLVDNVLVERIDPPYILFEPDNGEAAKLVSGEVGTVIEAPANPAKFGYNFKGWYTDKECTQKFTNKTLEEGMALTVYAGYTQASTFKYTFENYGLKPNKEAPGKYHMEDVVVVSAKNAVSGSKVARFDRTGNINPGASAIAIAHGDQIFEAIPGTQYVVSVNYRFTKKLSNPITVSIIAAHKENMWANATAPSASITVNTISELNVWKTMNFVIDPTIIKENAHALYLRVQNGVGGIIEFDDIIITTVPKGYSATVIENGGCMSLPNVLVGKMGSSYASKLPEKAKREGYYFKGYFTKDTAGNYIELLSDDMKFGEKPVTVYARFFEYEIKQDFEGDFITSAVAYEGYTIHDFDYEVYDAEKQGNSKDNVTSGRYSLHRKGNSRYFENSVLLTLGNNLASGERYTVKMKVKLGKHLHTDGAIKIASGRNYFYAWYTTGEYYPVATIADIADGQWHEVSYTFNSVEGFVSIQTPGYAEIFIDDVVFNLVDKNTPLSTPPVYTEYVPALRDEQGNVINMGNAAIDVDAIIDASLEANNGKVLTVILCVGASVLVVAAVVLVLILIKRKRKAA